MIGIVGTSRDGTTALVRAAARRLGVAHVFVDADRCDRARLEVAATGDARLVRRSAVDLDRLSGVFVRLGSFQAPDGGSGRAQVVSGLLDWLDGADLRVCNRRGPSGSNSSKPYQGIFSAYVGFRVPDTLVTNAPEEVRRFTARYPAVIYKSVSGIRSIVTRWTEDDLRRLDCVRDLPTQFQACVPGYDVRVHVIGDTCLAHRIESASTDYRYAGALPTRVFPDALPSEIAARCVALVRALGLELGGVDLRRTPEGEWYCFEVNPAPAFAFYQIHTGQRVADAVVRWLDGGSATASAPRPEAAPGTGG